MTARLTLTTAALVEALAPMTAFLRKKKIKSDALVSFDGTTVRIEAGGIAGTAAATGEWAGEARLPGIFLATLSPALGRNGDATIEVADGLLVVRAGGMSFERACAWETSVRPALDLPMNATLADKVRLAYGHDDAALERSGLLRVAREAREDAERRIGKAVEVLAPLGVTTDQLRSLLKAR